jgi:hypothetical protein
MTACDPKGRDVVVKVADSPVRGDAPNLAVPAANVTVPVGTPFPDTDFTWAVKTVGLPATGVVEFTDRSVVVAASERCETGEERIAELHPMVRMKPESMSTQTDSRPLGATERTRRRR